MFSFMELHPREKSNLWKVLRKKKIFFLPFFVGFLLVSYSRATLCSFVFVCFIEIQDPCSYFLVDYDDNSLFKYYVEHLPYAFRWLFSGDSKRLPLLSCVLFHLGILFITNVASKLFIWWYDVLNASYGKCSPNTSPEEKNSLWDDGFYDPVNFFYNFRSFIADELTN